MEVQRKDEIRGELLREIFSIQEEEPYDQLTPREREKYSS